jgi:hypothetical protein
MGKKPNLQKWAFQFLNLLVVAMATFFGEALSAPRCAITTKTGNVPLTTESEEKD